MHILDQLGFNDLTMTPSILPDHLLVKQNKLIKKFQKKVVTNYLLDQMEIHGNDLMFSECKTVSNLRQMMSLIHLATNSIIFKNHKFLVAEELESWLEHFAETLSLNNLDLMNEIVKKMHFTCCIEILKLFPKNINYATNLQDTFCIIMAMIQESNGYFGVTTPDDYMRRPNFDDV